MSHPAVRRYVLGCGLAAALSALIVVPFARGSSGLAWSWGLGGWTLAALAGVLSGVALVRAHGRPDGRFVIVMGAGMLARLAAYAAGGAGAVVRDGREGFIAYIAGLGAAYVPTQLYEMVWFARAGGRSETR